MLRIQLSPRLIIGPYRILIQTNKFPDKKFFNAILVLTKEYVWNFIKIEYKNKYKKFSSYNKSK